MMRKEIVCTVCPVGCRITVTGEDGNIQSVANNGCKRGETYARGEFVCPMRVLATSVKTSGNPDVPLLSVRTDRAVPKVQLFACMDEIRKLVVRAPLHRGDVLLSNVADTGANIIATTDFL